MHTFIQIGVSIRVNWRPISYLALWYDSRQDTKLKEYEPKLSDEKKEEKNKRKEQQTSIKTERENKMRKGIYCASNTMYNSRYEV